MLASAERVERLCAESYAALYDSDDAVLAALGGVWRRVGELADARPAVPAVPGRARRDQVAARGLALFLRRYADGIEASPARLQQVEDRLALLERLKRKYGPTLADVIARRDALRRELERPRAGGDDRRSRARARAGRRASRAISRPRRAVSAARGERRATFARALVERCSRELAMEQTRFEVRFVDEPLAEARGPPAASTRREFFLSPNPGEDLRPLARIVSGGELSRVMLAIKTLTATSRHGFSDAGERPPSASAPG